MLAYNGVLNSALIGRGLSEADLVFSTRRRRSSSRWPTPMRAFAILPIYVALETIPKSLIEAASDLGARPSTHSGA